MKVSIKIDKISSREYWVKERKVVKHKRKANGEEYAAPRIVLSSEYNDFIGREFRTYIAEGTIIEEDVLSEREYRGTMLILLFPESESKREKSTMEI